MEKNTYIGIMIQSLRKKEIVLKKIMSLNMKQKEQLEDPNLEPDDFDEIIEQKARCIEQLEQLDSGFENLFLEVREEMLTRKDEYREEIKELKELIRNIVGESADIQAQEARNKNLMDTKFKYVKSQVREIRSSQKIVNQYYHNMMNSNYIEPQFLDNKK